MEKGKLDIETFIENELLEKGIYRSSLDGIHQMIASEPDFIYVPEQKRCPFKYGNYLMQDIWKYDREADNYGEVPYRTFLWGVDNGNYGLVSFYYDLPLKKRRGGIEILLPYSTEICERTGILTCEAPSSLQEMREIGSIVKNPEDRERILLALKNS